MKLLLALTLALADEPRTVTPADIQRAAATLRLLQVARGGQFDDPELKSAVEAFLKANPNFDANAFKGLLRDTPGATIPPGLREQAVRIAKDIAAERAKLAAGQPATPGVRPPGQAPSANRPPEDEVSPLKPSPDEEPATPPDTPQANPAELPTNNPGAPPPPPGNAKPDDRGGQALRWWERHVGPLDKTPAFQGIVKEFLRAIDPKSPSRGALGDLLKGDNGRRAGEWAAAISEALGGFKSAAADAAATMPGSPDLELPATPSAPSLPRAGLLLAAIGLLVAAAFVWRRAGLPGVGGEPRLRRVPAPQPASVRDRASLVAAVDQLGAHLLGPEALPLNHKALERSLNKRGPVGAVAELIGLYELARYAPMHEAFPVERLSAARSALVAVLDTWR